jgi:hypothetical protein
MRRRMQPRQLKSLIETGHYRLEPALVAEAMLERRGVRTLLMQQPDAVSPAGRTPSAPAAGRRAA